MATPQDSKPVPQWVDDDPEIELTMDMDDDEEVAFDEFSGEESVPEKIEGPRDVVPLWRLIEMSQEKRSLKMELADFEDYDDFESYDGDYSGELPH